MSVGGFNSACQTSARRDWLHERELSLGDGLRAGDRVGHWLRLVGCLPSPDRPNGRRQQHQRGRIALDSADQCRQVLSDLVGAEAADEVSRPGSFAGFSASMRRSRSSGRQDGPHLAPTGFVDAAQELDMRLVEVARCGRRPKGNAPTSRTNRRTLNPRG